MKKLLVEWKHYDKNGETCSRCGGTGRNLLEACEELKADMAVQGVELSLRETLLGQEDMAQSNLLLLNGVPLEEVLEGARAGESECASCSCLAGQETDCRTLVIGGTTYEEIPKEKIREAIIQVARQQ